MRLSLCAALRDAYGYVTRFALRDAYGYVTRFALRDAYGYAILSHE